MFAANPTRYHIILMDIQMPEMDGYEATMKIRASDAPNAKDIPIVAITSNIFVDDVERCIESGMNSHIGKPVSFDMLFGVLHEYCV
jgi:CheY-like chemotaxis protein